MVPEQLLTVAGVLASLGAMAVAIRQADIARTSARDAKESAEAAKTQARVMEEQWAAQQEEAALAARPSYRAQVLQEQAQSYLVLINQGASAMHVTRVLLDGEDTNFLRILVSKETPPAKTIIPPDDMGTVFRGIHRNVNAYGVAYGPRSEWGSLVVEFVYGPEGKRWQFTGEVMIQENGLIVLRNQRSSAVPLLNSASEQLT